MAKPRTQLQALLREKLGSKYVYFRPPSTVKMTYPCIVYERSKIDGEHADNQIYKTNVQYTLTAIYTDPDSTLPFELAKIPTAKHSGHFVSDNLYHDVFTIFY